MATKPHLRKNDTQAGMRASWRGQLRFGLVAFEVQAVNAAIKENSGVHFHLLHAPDHQRIRLVKICPKHGEVPKDEIVEGFEVAKGNYVEFEKQELDALKSVQDKVFVIDAFIGSEDVDPIYFDGRTYYLIPAGSNSSEAYGLLAAAMEKKDRWGIGQIVFFGREQLAVVRSLDGVLTMAMLNYYVQIRKPAEIKRGFSAAHSAGRKLSLAEELVGRWHDKDFDFRSYRDRYREKLELALKLKKKRVVRAADEREEPEVINLMQALQRSVARAGSTRKTHAAGKANPKGVSRKGQRDRRRA